MRYFCDSEGECQCANISVEIVFYDIRSDYEPSVAELPIQLKVQGVLILDLTSFLRI